MRPGQNSASGSTLLFILNRFIDDDSWLIWQLADSAFPAGGFAHSGGLEAAWQHGEVRDAAELASFIESSLWQTASSMIPFLVAAHDDPPRLEQFDALCDAFLSNHVANRASRLQGRAFWNSALRIFAPIEIANGQLGFYHFAPTFGAIARALRINRPAAAELFLFQGLRGLVAAAVRLGIAGPMEGQSLQHRLALRAREMLSLTEKRTVDEVASVAPLLEIWQGGHDRLYSRLFQT